MALLVDGSLSKYLEEFKKGKTQPNDKEFQAKLKKMLDKMTPEAKEKLNKMLKEQGTNDVKKLKILGDIDKSSNEKKLHGFAKPNDKLTPADVHILPYRPGVDKPSGQTTAEWIKVKNIQVERRFHRKKLLILFTNM